MLDSGCTNHMTREKSMFSSYSPMTQLNEKYCFWRQFKGDVISLGKLAITLKHSITNVLHVDSLSYNLLSISQLCEMGYNCLFSDMGVVHLVAAVFKMGMPKLPVFILMFYNGTIS